MCRRVRFRNADLGPPRAPLRSVITPSRPPLVVVGGCGTVPVLPRAVVFRHRDQTRQFEGDCLEANSPFTEEPCDHRLVEFGRPVTRAAHLDLARLQTSTLRPAHMRRNGPTSSCDGASKGENGPHPVDRPAPKEATEQVHDPSGPRRRLRSICVNEQGLPLQDPAAASSRARPFSFSRQGVVHPWCLTGASMLREWLR